MRSALVRIGVFMLLCGSISTVRGNEVVLPGSVQVSTTGRARDAVAAYNAVDRTWLVVWREDHATTAGAGDIMGRIVREDRTFVAAPFVIGGGVELSSPRAAHDPIRNEWLVVWGGAPFFDGGRARIVSRKISSTGAFVGDGAVRLLSTDTSVIAFPDVAAAQSTLNIINATTQQAFLVVWQEDFGALPGIMAVRVFDDPNQPGRLGATAAFRVDSDASLPGGRRSTRPRLTEFAPLTSGTSRVGALNISTSESFHRVAFEVESGGQKDVYLAAVNLALVKSTVRVTQTAESESAPVIAYSPVSQRTVVLFERPGSVLRGQLLGEGPAAGLFNLVGPDFPVASGITPAVSIQVGTDIFFASAENAGRLGLGCVAGQRVLGTPSAGTGVGSTQPFVSPSSGGGVCLSFLRTNTDGTRVIRASIVPPLAAIPNNPPVARAGDELQVAESTLFNLDGTASNDPDADPLRHQWARTDGGSPEDFFVAAGESVKARPQLQAPSLGPDLQPITLTYRLAVDDFRSAPPFAGTDTVTVTVVPGVDVNPPVARAGPDATVDEDAIVRMDGTASSDPDGDPLTFSWTLVSVAPPVVPPASIAVLGANTPRPSFTAPRFGQEGGIDIRFRLTVTTPRGGQGEDEVVIHVRDSINDAPDASAGPDVTVDEAAAFILDGSGSLDPNGDALTFRWEVLGTLGGLNVSFSDPASPAPEVVVQVPNDLQITIRLTVRDPSGAEDSDEVSVRIRALPMQVTSIVPMAGAPGTRVAINGVSLDSPGIRVFFGPEDFTHSARIERISDRQLVVIVPPAGPRLQRALTNGRHLRGMIATEFFGPDPAPITVVKGSERFVSTQQFVSPHMEIFEAWLTQGVEAYPLVQGKHTLLHVRVRTALGPQTPLPGLTLTPPGTVPLGASCTAFPAGGASFQIPPANVPATALARTAAVTDIDQAVNFFLTPSQTLVESFRFEVHLFLNGVEVASLRTEQDSLPFTRTHVPRILVFNVVPYLDGSPDPSWVATQQADHHAKVDAAFASFGRVYPFTSFSAQDHVVFNPNLVTLRSITGDDGKIRLQDFEFSGAFFNQVEAFHVLGSELDAYNDSVPPAERAQIVLAMIAEELQSPDSQFVGVAIPPVPMMADLIRFTLEQNVGPADDVVNFVLDLVGGAICVASFGLFCEDPIETILSAVLGLFQAEGLEAIGNISLVIANNKAGPTLAQEVGHNLGMVNPFERFHDAANPSHSSINEVAGPSFFGAPSSSGLVLSTGPVLNTVQAEAKLFLPQGPLPKSVMAYVDDDTNRNCFFEPNHFQRVFNAYRVDGGLGGAAEVEAAAGGGGGAGGPTLYLAGAFSFLTEELRVTEARPGLPGESVSREMAGSPLTIAFLAPGGATLEEHSIYFHLSVPVHTHSEGHNEGLQDLAAFFRAVAEIPQGTARAELRFQEKTLWTRSALGAAPEIQLLAPAGGQVVARDAELVVRWQSADADGDELTHGVYYSRDGGATFVPLAVSVRGSELRWATAAAAGSEASVVKVVAHDGFHSAQAISPVFRLGGGRPKAAILAPEAGATALSSRPLALAGLARAPGGAAVTDDGAYRWSSSVAGALGEGRELLAGPLEAGTHRLRLEVAVGGDTASAEVEVVVLSDRDGDGTADAAELAAGLDPDNPEDVSLDEDEDGLATGPELLVFGTNPRQVDSDGDGIPDGEEVLQGTSPTSRDTDGDGRLDNADNCPSVANADQADANGDGIGDLCDVDEVSEEPVFRRGDANGDGAVDITDPVFVLGYLFLGGAAPVCDDAADANDDATIDITDAVFTLGYLFLGSEEPRAPGPDACGVDPTADPLSPCAYPVAECR